MIFLNKEDINKNIDIMRMLNNGGLPLGAKLEKLTERGEWIENNLCYLGSPYKVKYRIVNTIANVPNELLEIINKNELHIDTNYITVDQDGQVCGFDNIPKRDGIEWIPERGEFEHIGELEEEFKDFKNMIWDAGPIRELAKEYNKTTNHVSQKGNE